ncbi:unnamed protein product [Closterium sp. NIES-53]
MAENSSESVEHVLPVPKPTYRINLVEVWAVGVCVVEIVVVSVVDGAVRADVDGLSSRRVLSSQDVTFDESVPYYRLFPYRTAPLPPPPLFLAPGPPPIDPLPPHGPAPSGVSQVDAVEPVEVAVDSGAARGAASAGAGSEGAEPGGAESGGAESGGAEPLGAESGGAEPGAEPNMFVTEPNRTGTAEGDVREGANPNMFEFAPCSSIPGGTEPGGAEPGGAGSARVASRGTLSRREFLSPQELREWFAWCWSRAAGAGGTTGAAGAAGGAGAPGHTGTGPAGATGAGAAGANTADIFTKALPPACFALLDWSLADEADWDEQNVDNASKEAGPLPYCSVPIPMDDENPRESVNAETYFDFADTGYVTPQPTDTNISERIGPNFLPDPEAGDEAAHPEDTNLPRYTQSGLQILGLVTVVHGAEPPKEPATIQQALGGEHREKWREAMDKELLALLTIAAMNRKKIRQIDVANAFLYTPVDAEIFVELPHESNAGPNQICQLEKSLYGIKQAPGLWQQYLHAHLIRIGFLQLPHDQGMCRLTKCV